MTKTLFLAAASLVALTAAAPAPAPKTAPVARYAMDLDTQDGLASGMAAMLGGSGGPTRLMNLSLWGKNAPAGGQGDHAVPTALGLGASLPLLAPEPAGRAEMGGDSVGALPRPKGRILMYWGCSERVGPGQPKIVDLAKMMPSDPQMKAYMAQAQAARKASAGAGASRDVEWPNRKDSRAIPGRASLVGAHRVTSAYTPEIAFSMTPSQDFMPGLKLHEAGSLPSGAARLAWTVPAQATGYTLSLTGVTGEGGDGDIVMWTSTPGGTPESMDYMAPAEVAAKVKAGRILPPATSQCLLPAEVAAKVPMGMVMMVGYGPYDHFSDLPKNPTWTVRVRNKTSATMMRGMPAMPGMPGMGDGDGAEGGQAAAAPQPKRKKRGFGLGDVLKAVVPAVVPAVTGN